jgi:TonB family protein
MRLRSWLTVFWLVMPTAAWGAMPAPFPRWHVATFERRESQVARTLTRASQFVDVSHLSSRTACEQIQPPEALTTPDPLSTRIARGQKIKVSFIIGTDGRVHSPLILESAGIASDRHVLQTVRTWRYRPAICNGVPTETEGRIEFSSR